MAATVGCHSQHSSGFNIHYPPAAFHSGLLQSLAVFCFFHTGCVHELESLNCRPGVMFFSRNVGMVWTGHEPKCLQSALVYSIHFASIVLWLNLAEPGTLF